MARELDNLVAARQLKAEASSPGEIEALLGRAIPVRRLSVHVPPWTLASLVLIVSSGLALFAAGRRAQRPGGLAALCGAVIACRRLLEHV